ncbi:Alcohol dehydrogenase superfamily [Macleaya cordata]|uniref:Alcohol dehydrogenase superfamily n=1 Tax=Macleaya cordata TaxID=56857 RepID=A0A200QXX3_MACCD|nr:Alcohol dehydrogenase superfamily [Macleaya cordata]
MSSSTVAKEVKLPVKAFGWAARKASGVLSPFTFNRRATGEDDVTMKVLYCGICPFDLHSIKHSDSSEYPLVPGHEIVGEVTEVGDWVRKFKVGDKVGVGCMIGPLHSCSDSDKGCKMEPAMKCCLQNIIKTYYHGAPSLTYGGGLSDIMVVKERFVVRFPDNLPPDAGAPLLCAGITVYSSMQFYGLNKPHIHLGVVLGGFNGHLSHLAVRFAKAFGVKKVTVISSSPAMENEAIQRLGADSFLVLGPNNQDEQMQAARGTMDGIIHTLPAVSSLHQDHVLPFLTGLLKSHGKMVQVGEPSNPKDLPHFDLFMEKTHLLGGSSATKRMKKTQKMIDFAAEHNITADVEVIRMDYVNTAMRRLDRADVKYCFVVDVANTLTSSTAGVPKLEIMKWNAVAHWAWDMYDDTCAICRFPIMDLCIECKAAELAISSVTTTRRECQVVWGVCNHAFHLHCVSEWVRDQRICPVDGKDWQPHEPVH